MTSTRPRKANTLHESTDVNSVTTSNPMALSRQASARLRLDEGRAIDKTTAPLHETEFGTPAERLNHVNYLMGLLSNKLVNTGSSLFRKHFDVGFMEFRTLVAVALHRGISPNEIAESAGVDKAAISRSVSLLSDSGHIVATPETASLRFRRYVLTPSGRELFLGMRAIADEHERRLLSALDTEEVPLLMELLRRMTAKISYMESYDPKPEFKKAKSRPARRK